MLPFEVLRELETFVEQTDSTRFARNLRKMLLTYMLTEEAKEASYTDDLLIGLERIFHLLDVISDASNESR